MQRDIFQAIADPTRRAILMSLRTHTQQPINSLAKEFDMSRQAVSLHIQYLQSCGAITIQKRGRQRFCQLNNQGLKDLDDWLAPFRALWEKRFNELDELLENLQSNQNSDE